MMAGVPITFNNAQNGLLSNAQSAIQNSQNVSTASESGTTVTITTVNPHGFSSGQTVTISGVGVGYDGQYVLTSASGSTLAYTAGVSGLSTLGSGGTATVPVGTATLTFTANQVGLGAADAWLAACIPDNSWASNRPFLPGAIL